VSTVAAAIQGVKGEAVDVAFVDYECTAADSAHAATTSLARDDQNNLNKKHPQDAFLGVLLVSGGVPPATPQAVGSRTWLSQSVNGSPVWIVLPRYLAMIVTSGSFASVGIMGFLHAARSARARPAARSALCDTGRRPCWPRRVIKPWK
jgi:hypothetical protein